MDFYTITGGVLSKCMTLENSSTKFGDGSNYTNFNSVGRQTMSGTGRVLEKTLINLEGLEKGATAPTVTRVGNLYGYAFGINDDGYLQFDVPWDHDLSEGQPISIHLYINEAYATNSGEVRFQGAFSCIAEGESVVAPTHSGTLDSGDINIPATANALFHITLGTIPADHLTTHDTVTILLTRIALVAGNNPTAEPVVLHVDFESVKNSLGA